MSENLILWSNTTLKATPVDDAHLATKTYVDSAITTVTGDMTDHIDNTAVHVPAQNAEGYVFLSNATATSSGTWTAIGTADSNVAENGTALVTGGAVFAYITGLNLATTYAPISHEHTVSEITDFPDFAVYGTTASDSTTTFATPDYVGDAITALNLGTVVTKDYGTSEGQIPILGSGGKLSTSVIPAIISQEKFAVGGETTSLADATTAMTGLSNAQVGDYCYMTYQSGNATATKVFMLLSDEANAYATASNWVELKNGETPYISSVNGYTTQNVTLTYTDVNAIGSNALVTTVSASSTDVTVPSALAVYNFAKNASNLTEGTIPVARLPLATDSTAGAVIAGTGINVTNGEIEVDFASYGDSATGTDTATTPNYVTEALAAERYDGTITGDGATTEFTITHNLGKRDVFVQFIDQQNRLAIIGVTFTSENSLTAKFDVAPTASDTFRVLVRI